MAFDPHTTEEHAQSIAAWLPNGRTFESKNIKDSNLNKFLLGIADEFRLTEEFISDTIKEHDINTTTQFINEWEKALGIPDECFSGTGTLEERRRDVITKLCHMNVATEEDFINLAARFGIEIEIQNAIQTITFPLTFPIPMFDSEKDARFTMIVTVISGAVIGNVFPLTFPFVFDDTFATIIECIFRKLKPASVNLIFRNAP